MPNHVVIKRKMNTCFVWSNQPVELSRASWSMLKPDPSNVSSAVSVMVIDMVSVDRRLLLPVVTHVCATLV